MSTQTYSFQEVTLVLSHPDLGQIVMDGDGVGTISIDMSNDRTDSDIGADGTVVVNKIRDRRGAMSLSCFNTSSLHSKLKTWYNYLEQADAAAWAGITATVKSKSTDESTRCKGVAFTKLPKEEYGQKATLVEWPFFAADVQQDVA